MDTLFAIGLVTALNLIIIKIKWEKERYGDAIMDVSTIAIMNILIGTSVNGAIIAMIASLVISIYLWFFPPSFGFNDENINDSTKEQEQQTHTQNPQVHIRTLNEIQPI